MKQRYTRDDLTDKQKEWLDRFIELGGTRQAATTAAKIAYGYTDNSASVQAYKLLRNEKIQEILVDECVATFAAGAVMATEQLVDVVTTGQWHGQIVKPGEGLKAISILIERGIGPIAQIHEHRHNHEIESLSPKELQGKVIEELRKLPDQDRAAMLAQLGGGEIIDVDAVEVDPEAPWGRKKDGTPKQKPGREKHKGKRVLPGPQAYKPEPSDPVKDRIARIKAKKLKQKREAAQEALDEK